MKNFNDYNLEELKKIFDNAVADTRSYIKSNGLVDGFKEEFGDFVSTLYVDYEDGEIFHHLDLPWSSTTGLCPRLYYSKGISIVTAVPEVQPICEYGDECSVEELQEWYEEYVDQILEFITFEEFTDFLETLT